MSEDWSRDEKVGIGKTITKTKTEKERECVGGTDSTSCLGMGGSQKREGMVGRISDSIL